MSAIETRSHIDYEQENASRSNWLDITGGTAKDSLTLLDYFAGKALEGIMSAEYSDLSYEEVAKYAYKCAEKMLEARTKIFTPQNVVRGVTGRSYG